VVWPLLAAGVGGFLLKGATAAQAVQAVRAMAAGGTYLVPAVAVAVPAGAPGQAAGAGDLSEREDEVLRQIAQGHTNKEIAARLGVTTKTVETYKARAVAKLGFRLGRVDLMRYAVIRGWPAAE
jgi:DNA-binding NarL/FixJ family response regulator